VEQPDEQLVRDLEEVAEAAARRGGHEAASAAWERAAELTVGPEPRAHRLFRAAESSWLSGDPARARVLAHSAEVDASDPLLRVHVLRLLGQVEWNTKSLNEGYAYIVQAAQLAVGVDDAIARQLTMLSASLAAWGASGASGPDPTGLLPPVGPDAPPTVQATMHLLQGFRAVAARAWKVAAEAFRTAFAIVEASDVSGEGLLQPNLGIAAVHIDDDDRGLRLHSDQLIAARRSGALTMAEHGLTRGFQFQLATGRWVEAAAAATEALDLASSIGDTGLTAFPNAQLAVLAALRGENTAEGYLETAAAIRDAHPLGITAVLVTDLLHWARGLTEPNTTAAVNHLERIASPPIRRLAVLDRVEAAVRAGRTDLAEQWRAEVAEFADGTGAPSAIAASEHAAALLADPSRAEKHFKRALEAHAGSLRLPDRARTSLAYGEFLRRVGRRVDAREHLRAALTVFEELRAGPQIRRAEQELRASGETARRNKPSSSSTLTPTEAQVAQLVAQGLANRDVAAQLFVSPRTVDFHLRNVYAKLGITSRGELAHVPLQ
jgi:DNA-binding CsgD family transcriptional regulator